MAQSESWSIMTLFTIYLTKLDKFRYFGIKTYSVQLVLFLKKKHIY